MQLNTKARATKAKARESVAPAAILPAPPAEIILPESVTATEAPATEAPAEPVYKSAARDAATIVAAATNFSQYSDRDTAYLAFFGSVMRPNGDTATLAEIHAAGKPRPGSNLRDNPHYTGSAKATDAGAINRLVKAGYITVSESGSRLHATEAAKSQAAYNKH